MEKLVINGYAFNNFGENNYSHGMELITSTDRVEEIVKKVRLQEPGFENVWFNPSAPCNSFEFFGVLGTEEQYKKFYEEQKASQIAKKMIEVFGWNNWPDKEITDRYETKLLANYKDWWE